LAVRKRIELDDPGFTGLKFTGLKFTGLKFTGLKFTGLKFTGLGVTGPKDSSIGGLHGCLGEPVRG
jgi:hypothetical protein